MRRLTVLEISEQIVEICKSMHQHGFICGSDGNVSYRLDDERYIITPSGLNKGFIKAKDLVIIDRNGKVLSRNGLKASTEYRMHVKVYDLRKDVNAVIHAHPSALVAFTVAGVRIPACILPETVLTMADIPLTRYAAPTSPDNAIIIEDYIKRYDAMVLDRHGSITVGKDLMAAYNKLEKIEHTAQTAISAKVLGGINPLPKDEINRLVEMGKMLGVLDSQIACNDCTLCAETDPSEEQQHFI